jgi:hypothetical protein
MRRTVMNRFKVIATIFCLSLMALVFSPSVQADTWNKKTVVTFSKPVEIPGGIVLPAGTYVFELVDTLADRHIVRIFNKDRTRVFATILAIPNWRLNATNKTVMTFGERSAGSPEAIRAWFYPGDNLGQEFVYPKRRAVELAKVTSLPVFAMPSELEPAIITPTKSADEEPVVALKQAPLTAVTPAGEEVEIAQVVTPLPPRAPEAQPVQAMPERQTEPADAAPSTRRLPQTASPLPLLGLIGLLSLVAGLALWSIPKWAAYHE